MVEDKKDTGWTDSGHGYMVRSKAIRFFKPFKLEEELQNTWCISIPDGKGNVTNYGGHWVDGKKVEEWREIVPDPFHKITHP
jgi:hypothetical protein